MTDVLIVGAGPTGLTLACDLARQGVSYRIIEQSDEPARGSRGFTLKPRTLEVFDDLGVADRILAAGSTRTPLRFHLGTEPLFDLDVPPARADAAHPYPNPVALPEWRTEAILRERLAELGGAVEFGRRLTGFTATTDGVAATLSDGAVVHARYLVGADGGRSRVRSVLGIPFTGRTEEDTRALIADVRLHGLDRRYGVHMWVTADGHVLAARPTPHADNWQVVVSLDGDAPASLETVQTAFAARTGRDDITASDPEWMSVWRYNLRMVETYRAGPVFLAGDAAHVHSPFGGHGMNTGIQDAYNLGWKLGLVTRGRADQTLLDSYGTERVPVAEAILADSDRRFSGFTPPRAARPLVRLLVKATMARNQRHTRNDHPTYRSGPLTREIGRRRGRIHAGDVAPDAAIALDGRAARLFDLLRGSHFTVLAFGTAPDLEDLAGDVRTYIVGDRLTDDHGDLRRAYRGSPGTVVLIRPDGYVGLLARAVFPVPAGDRAIRAYLHDVGLRGEPRHVAAHS